MPIIKPKRGEPVVLGRIGLRRGATVSAVEVCSGPTVGVGLTSQRFRLRNAAGQVVAETYDDTMNAWPQHTVKQLRLAEPYVATEDESLMLEVYIDAIVPPSFASGGVVY